MKNALTLSFTDIRAADLPLVGGKGANLGEMTHAGFPIPTGFCVTTAAFTQFIDEYTEADALYAELGLPGFSLPHQTVHRFQNFRHRGQPTSYQ